MWAGIGQAVESAAIAVMGLVVCALVMLGVWGIDQGFSGDPLLQWRIAANAWLLGHGVDVGITLGREAVIAVGLEEAGRSFVLTLGAWGIGLITFWLHWRSGRRIAQLPRIDAGIAVVLGVAATGAIGLLAGISAQHATAAPDLVQSALLPAAVALVGMLAAVLRVHGHDWLAAAARILTIEDRWMRAIRAAFRTGLGGAVAVLGVGALLVGVGLMLRFTEALLLMESLGVTHVGVAVVFLVQLALAPVAVVWGASWAIGPGFMIGAGSSVSPLDTDLGPVPALPLLAAIDPNAQPWMAVVVVLPVLAAVVVGVLARQSLLAGTAERPVHWWELAVAAVGGGVLAGALLGGAAMLATGAAGPGRLAVTGPDAVLVAAWGALEVGVGLLIGMLAGGRGTGALAGGFAVPLATEREGSSIRDFFGFGAGRDESDEEVEVEPLTWDEQPTEQIEPLAADEQPTEQIVPLPADEQTTERIEPLSADEQPTERIGPLTVPEADAAPKSDGDASGGDATDGGTGQDDAAESTHPHPEPESAGGQTADPEHEGDRAPR